MQTMQDQTGKGMHHRGEGADGNHIPRHLDRFLLGLASDLLPSRLGGTRGDVPDVAHDLRGVGEQDLRETRVGRPGFFHRRLVDRPPFCGQSLRNIGPGLAQLHETLRRLFGVVEGVRMQEGPHEMPRDVLETELEGRVLEDRVMTRGEGQGTDGLPLPFGDLRILDHPRRIAGARGRDRPVVGAGTSGTQRDFGRAGDDHAAPKVAEPRRSHPAAITILPSRT